MKALSNGVAPFAILGLILAIFLAAGFLAEGGGSDDEGDGGTQFAMIVSGGGNLG